MRYITSFPSIERFLWETKTYVNSLKRLGVKPKNIIILTTNDDYRVVKELHKLDATVFSFDDKRANKDYIPSLKPYLMYQFLLTHPDYELTTFLYHDSDVVFLERFIDNDYFGNTVYGSDTNSYMNYDYLMWCSNMDKYLQGMLDIVGVTEADVKRINDDSIGAQYIIPRPTAYLFRKIYDDSVDLWEYIKDKDTNFQKWVVEMFATLWNFIYFGYEIKLSNDLSFAWSTDNEYKNQRIIHNAGVVDESEGLFFKGNFMTQPKIEDLDINSGKVSDMYVDYVKRALYGDDK